MKEITIESAILAVDDWRGSEITYESVAGGITNPNYKVKVDGCNYFLKIPGTATDYIDRNNCHIANEIAAFSKSGPKVFYYFEETGVEIFEWLDGYRQVTYNDVYEEQIFDKIFEKMSAFHNVENQVMPVEKSIIDQAWEMNEKARESGYLPPWNDRMEYLLNTIEDAVNNGSLIKKPCHNDFWTNNIMYNENSDDLKIIDYEYASMNDPYTDLAIISDNNYFTEDMDVAMMKVYSGERPDEDGFARLKLYKIANDIKWAYWSLFQNNHSDVDFDYMNWYGTKIARLQNMWQDPRLDFWINRLKHRTIFREK